MSLLARLFFVVAIALLPVVLVGVAEGVAHRRATETQLHAGAARLAAVVGMNEERVLDVTERYLGSVAQLDVVADDKPRCGYVLTRLAKPFPVLAYLALYDTTGAEICASDGASSIAADTAARPFFQRAIESGKPAVGAYAPSPSGGVLQIAVPVGEPQAHGVLVAGIGLTPMAAALPSDVLPPRASLVIADQNGTILARMPDTAGDFGAALPDADHALLAGGVPGVVETTAQDGRGSIKGYELDSGLFIEVGLDREAAYAGIEAEGRLQIVALNAALALGILMAWLCGRRFITKPVEQLADAARRWREGDWSARTALDDPDSELGQLGTVFDSMADAVADRERRLREALIAAATANQAKADFLSTMNHELRTPLNPILGLAELMLSEIHGPLNQRYRAYAQDIKQCGGHLLGVVDNLLDLSRVATGRLALSESVADPVAEVAGALRTVEGKAQDSGLLFEFDSKTSAPPLHCDVPKLRQMVAQLLSNAIKFTPAGGKVAVSVQCRDGELGIAVSDTGPGIAPEHLPRIAEPFFRAHDTYIRGDEGTGLGLAIVKAMIELHGGRLEIASELGHGTEAALIFPAWRLAGPEAAAA